MLLHHLTWPAVGNFTICWVDKPEGPGGEFDTIIRRTMFVAAFFSASVGGEMRERDASCPTVSFDGENAATVVHPELMWVLRDASDTMLLHTLQWMSRPPRTFVTTSDAGGKDDSEMLCVPLHDGQENSARSLACMSKPEMQVEQTNFLQGVSKGWSTTFEQILHWRSVRGIVFGGRKRDGRSGEPDLKDSGAL